jgi:CBS domain-containing protein
MFSIYGVTGQSFRGTLENLPGVTGLRASRSARGIAREGEELGPELVTPRRATSAGTQYEQAAQACRDMLHLPQGPILHAYQLMSRDVMTLGPELSVEAAWLRLAERGYGQAPVLDGALQLVGLVTVRDLLEVLNVVEGELRDVLSRTVAEVMTTPVLSADPVCDIRRVARVMVDYRLPALPVMSEQGELVGIISRSDILRGLIQDPPLSLWALGWPIMYHGHGRHPMKQNPCEWF